MKNTRRKLKLGLSNHNYQQTARSKQSVGNTVMKYTIAVTISFNKKKKYMPVRINNIYMYVCMYVCVYVYALCIHTYIYVCMYASYMCVCVYVCLYYIYICVYVLY